MREFMHKYRKNILIVIILGFILYLFILLRNDVNKVASKIKQINPYYFLLIFLMLFIYVFLEGVVIYIIAKRKVKGITLGDAFRVNLATQFFNAITPFSSGGQPFQIIYFKTRGIKVRDASSIILINFITYNIAFVLLGAICLIFKSSYFNQILVQEGYKYLLLIGFGINVFMTVISFFLTFSRKFYHLLIEVIWIKVIRWPIIRRFKLERKADNIKNAVEEFHSELNVLKKDKKLWFQSIIYHLIRLICFYMIPLFIFMALGENVRYNEVNIIVGAIFVAIVMSYVPTPGASGGAEGIFYLLFSFLKRTVIPALLLWRFTTYYLYIIFGFITLLTLNYKTNLKKINYRCQNEEDLIDDK